MYSLTLSVNWVYTMDNLIGENKIIKLKLIGLTKMCGICEIVEFSLIFLMKA